MTTKHQEYAGGEEMTDEKLCAKCGKPKCRVPTNECPTCTGAWDMNNGRCHGHYWTEQPQPLYLPDGSVPCPRPFGSVMEPQSSRSVKQRMEDAGMPPRSEASLAAGLLRASRSVQRRVALQKGETMSGNLNLRRMSQQEVEALIEKIDRQAAELAAIRPLANIGRMAVAVTAAETAHQAHAVELVRDDAIDAYIAAHPVSETEE